MSPNLIRHVRLIEFIWNATLVRLKIIVTSNLAYSCLIKYLFKVSDLNKYFLTQLYTPLACTFSISVKINLRNHIFIT